MEKGFQSIKRVSGRAPRGWRSPAAEISPITMPMLVEYGFDYSSNFFDDNSPYLHEVEGKETKIVELPFRWVLDDAPFFQYSIVLPGRTMQAPSALLEAWKGEFDVLYAEDRMMMVGMHPEMIGQPSRIKALEGLIEHALNHPNVWIGRCDEIVDDMRPALEAGAAGGEGGERRACRPAHPDHRRGQGHRPRQRRRDFWPKAQRVVALDRDEKALAALCRRFDWRSDPRRDGRCCRTRVCRGGGRRGVRRPAEGSTVSSTAPASILSPISRR